MTYRTRCAAVAVAVAGATLCWAPSARAAETTIRLADGKLQLTAPAEWAQKQPKFAGITLYEFAAPAVDPDKTDGRLTIGAAGGGIEANRHRWLAQFQQPDGSKTEDRAKLEQQQLAGCTVHRMDVAGTYQAPQFTPGGGGRFANYRMLGAIIDAGPRGTYYVRLYGPEKTVAHHAAAFDKMIASLTSK